MAAVGGQAAVTAADVAIDAQDAAQNNIAANPWSMDATYAREINVYQNLVAKQCLANQIPDGPRTLTRENVDLYFNAVVVERHLNDNSARRVVNALQRLADDYEYAGETYRFVIDGSQNVVQALAVLHRRYIERQNAQVSDPHSNLPTDT